MQHLVRANILSGVRGPRGGYRLARERRRITIGEIVRVVRAMERNEDALEAEGGSELGQRIVRVIWADSQKEFMERLDAITIEDLCRRAQDAGITSEASAKLDYTI
jgi:Rrf2 family protein